MADTYRVVRMFAQEGSSNRTIKRGLSLEQAQSHCRDPETNSKTARKAVNTRRTRKMGPWFDGYEKE